MDIPGSWHHVMSRGIARRVLFEDEMDIRAFLYFLALEARRGRIEIHAWCVLGTHFHLLVRSVTGELSAAMQRVLQAYARYFNRRYRRDGSLVRGRYTSKRVRSLLYRQTLVRYIDANPVVAQLADSPWQYPYGSASQYVHRSGPPWLSRDWVESVVNEWAGEGEFSVEAYKQRFGGAFTPEAYQIVEARMSTASDGPDVIGHLVRATAQRVGSWMRRKAMLADGCAVGQLLCTQGMISRVLESTGGELRSETRGAGRKGPGDKQILRVGLSRSLTGVSWKQLSEAEGVPVSTCRGMESTHRRLLLHDDGYASAAGVVVQECLRQTFV
jgi:REP element-mobilizing transposase RayT